MTFAIFGVFADDVGRSTHLANGADRTQEPAEQAAHIFAGAPDIRMADVLAVKLCEDLVTRGLIVGLEARRHAGADVEDILRGVLPLAVEEPDTVGWFAVRFGPSAFALMAYFADDVGRHAHRRGRVMEALAAWVQSCWSVRPLSTSSGRFPPSLRRLTRNPDDSRRDR